MVANDRGKSASFFVLALALANRKFRTAFTRFTHSGITLNSFGGHSFRYRQYRKYRFINSCEPIHGLNHFSASGSFAQNSVFSSSVNR